MNNPPDTKPAAAGLLETMTIIGVRAFQPEVMLIPLGSTEPHGPHLPYGTDVVIADRVSAEAVRLANLEDARVLRLPPMPFGNNVNFRDFPFACRIRVETLMAVVMDLVTFGVEEGVRKIILFNCHGGNDAALGASLRQIFDRFRNEAFVGMCGCGCFTGGLHASLFTDQSPHAGDYETSLMQFIAPEKMPPVAPGAAGMNRPAIPSLAEGRVSWIKNWAHFMPESFAGEPNRSSAEKGRDFFEADVAGLAKFLIDLSRAPWHPHFPYAPQVH
jgi:creatinine amidohydrolase